jgi:hypothetical protein
MEKGQRTTTTDFDILKLDEQRTKMFVSRPRHRPIYLINKSECVCVCVCVSVCLSVCISRKNYTYCWLVRHCYVFLLLQQQLKQRRFYGR